MQSSNRIGQGQVGSTLRHQFPVGEVVGVHDAPEGIVEDVRVISVVGEPFNLLEIAVQMLDADLVKGSHVTTTETR